jgi:teichuronic acid biosynthesis glycosyltransferase TuaC
LRVTPLGVVCVRILLIANNFPWAQNIDGIFNLLHARALRDRGHEVRVLRWAPWSPPLLRARWKRYRSIPSRYTIDDITVRTIRVLLGPRHRGIATLPFQARAALADEIAAFAPDVVHAHGLLPAGALALGASVPFVVTGHGSEVYRAPYSRPPLHRMAERIVARAAANVGVSNFIANHLRAFGARDARVIFNGADDRVFFPRDRAAARAALGLQPDGPTIVYAGHMYRDKGMYELLEAVRAIRDLKPQLVMAGGGELQGHLANELQSMGVDARFPGFVSHDELAPILAACDVVTLPSYAEGLPVSLCEAMCSGRAIVATRVGGIPEIVHDERTGFIVEPRDGPALADRLRRVLTDAPLKARFEAAALAFAREELTWSANARAYEATYERILGDARRSGHAETRTLTGCPTGT